ncbi:hypothetical protein KDV77_22030 [Serratia marcescens]
MQTHTHRAASCEIIRSEKASSSSRNGSGELRLLLELLRPNESLNNLTPGECWLMAETPEISKVRRTKTSVLTQRQCFFKEGKSPAWLGPIFREASFYIFNCFNL